MKTFNIKTAPLLTATLASLLLGAAGSVSANTVTMLNYNGAPPGTIDCDVSCQGFVGVNDGELGSISLSESQAQDYTFAGNPTAELGLLNDLLDQIPEPNVSFVNKTDSAGSGFSTDLQYFSIKKAGEIWFFKNTSGGTVDISVNGETYSHWTEYGTEVPIPAAAWLFGSGLIGLAGIARKKKNA